MRPNPNPTEGSPIVRVNDGAHATAEIPYAEYLQLFASRQQVEALTLERDDLNASLDVLVARAKAISSPEYNTPTPPHRESFIDTVLQDVNESKRRYRSSWEAAERRASALERAAQDVINNQQCSCCRSCPVCAMAYGVLSAIIPAQEPSQ